MLQRLAGASPFASLRRNSSAIRAAEDEKKKDDEDEKSKKSKAEDEQDDEAKKSKAEDDDKKKDDEDEKSKKSKADDKKKDDEDEKSKKSKADEEDGDDESDREDEDEPEARSARARERGRIAAICEAGLRIGNADAAYHLAIGSSMSRRNAIAMLESIGPAKAAARSDTLRDRMANTRQPDIGAGDPSTPSASDPKSLAGRIVAAHRKALGEAA